MLVPRSGNYWQRHRSHSESADLRLAMQYDKNCNFDQALRIYQRLAAGGNKQASLLMAKLYLRHNHFTEAYRLFKALASQGDMHAEEYMNILKRQFKEYVLDDEDSVSISSNCSINSLSLET